MSPKGRAGQERCDGAGVDYTVDLCLENDMLVVVASHNPAKIDAVQRAFAAVFPRETLDLQPVRVPSGVKDQPDSDEETRRGAWNRARAARESHFAADAWVGLEGGLERIDGQWLASAWMVVIAADGREGQARTPTLPLPPQVTALVDAGEELGVANDRVFGSTNSKQGGGAFGLLTGGRMTRGGIYAQTLELALLPVVHDLWIADTER
ncbi:MAG: inosine/xanthosine triphosphatase [Xanthomonadales bacterium]|jgi:inosine/xanthosine triphosphatase|nr:inosine/xanthosine triphosphatase [Xanthomonadales bacterium]